ncbi:MAG: ABC transporter substrate-binding protein [Hydrotalea sp.]|nr:ABC transporter substrate-binding protein [Hydrotalea sp.]
MNSLVVSTKKNTQKVAKRFVRQIGATAAVALVAGLLTATFPNVAKAACDTPNKMCGNELKVFDYGGNNIIGWVPDYAKKYPKAPTWLVFVDTGEALAKVRGGFQVDIANLSNSDNSKDNPYWLDYIQPWDTSKITGWKDIYPFWKNAPGFEPINGKYYMIPTYFGIEAAVYDSRRIQTGEIKSLKDFADPKYKGRVFMPDTAYDNYAFCMLAMGMKKPFLKLTKADIDTCDPFLRSVAKNVRLYYTDSDNVVVGLKTGELWLGWAWMDQPLTANKERAKDPKGDKKQVILDRELGIALFASGMVLLKNAKPANIELAYDYTNALLNGGADWLVHQWGYGSPNKKSMDALEAKEPNLLKKHYIDNLESYVKSNKAVIFATLPKDVNDYAISKWEQIKSGAAPK